MSSWVHVNAVMRINAMRFGTEDLNFDEVIGKECLFKSDESTWYDAEANPNLYLPMGSEGSLHKSVWIDPDRSNGCPYTVSIFGDLRDCYQEDAEKIIDWFKQKCKDLWIRDAVITTKVNDDKPLIYVYEWHHD